MFGELFRASSDGAVSALWKPAPYSGNVFYGGLAVDPQGRVYASDLYSHSILRFNPSAREWIRVAGTGAAGFAGDEGPAEHAKFHSPGSLAFDSQGNLYVADTQNGRVRMIDTNGVVRTVAGDGSNRADRGNGGLAKQASVWPFAIALDPEGRLLIADAPFFPNDPEPALHAIRRVEKDGTIQMLAGSTFTHRDANVPLAVAADAEGTVFFADFWRIRRIGPVGVETIAGSIETRGFSGDGGDAKSSLLVSGQSLTFGPDGNLYFADSPNQRVRRIRFLR